jgi:subtilisin family serine protease
VEWIEEVVIPRVEVIPNDPLYGSQTHLPQILAPAAWDIQKGDSGVVIAIVDNGFDIAHPDLAANVFTNELEASGLPGVDDDGNGRVDDIHGYDVADNDANPSPCPPDPDGWYDHGTLVAGTAAAVTNNALGVAGVSWNCEFMPVKASYNGSPQSISKGYTGITYAAETGADVINCSWGSFGSPSQYNQDVITYAYGLGSLVIAAAGNDPTSQLHYPSAYLNTLSVTWVNSSDHRAPSATWGITVDVSAPGVNMGTPAEAPWPRQSRLAWRDSSRAGVLSLAPMSWAGSWCSPRTTSMHRIRDSRGSSARGGSMPTAP